MSKPLRTYRNLRDRSAVQRLLARGDISSFTEPGCGIEMTLGKWYVMSDSDSYYAYTGFESVDAAISWWAAVGAAVFDAPPRPASATITVAKFISPQEGWAATGSPQIMKADDLLSYAMEQDFDELMAAQ